MFWKIVANNCDENFLKKMKKLEQLSVKISSKKCKTQPGSVKEVSKRKWKSWAIFLLIDNLNNYFGIFPQIYLSNTPDIFSRYISNNKPDVFPQIYRPRYILLYISQVIPAVQIYNIKLDLWDIPLFPKTDSRISAQKGIHMVYFENAVILIHKYSVYANTGNDKMTGIPIMCYIFGNHCVQGS